MYENLQNGSDIRGIALPGVEGEEVNITEDAVVRIAQSFAAWLAEKQPSADGRLHVAVGRDSRLSGETIMSWFMNGLAAAGVRVTDCGMASTPAMFMSTVLDGWKTDGGVMITASHLPFNRNGIKFFAKRGGLEKSDIASILAACGSYPASVPAAEAAKADLMADYSAVLRGKICSAVGKKESEKPLAGYHVVVDAGNGAGGFFVKQVLDPLGADTAGSQFLDPDGRFPNHIPNPENEKAMQAVVSATVASHADLGIVFDTDVDRAGAVLPSGEELNRNRLIAAVSAILLRSHPGTTIVTDSVTSTGLTEFIEAHGGRHLRYMRGYRNVINKSIELNRAGTDSQLAMETSGHGALAENYFLDDGAYLCVKLLTELARGGSIEKLVADLREPAEGEEFRMHFKCEENFRENGKKILADLDAEAGRHEGWSKPKQNFEGVRVNLDRAHGDGWFLLRMSLHEPLMPLNIESDSKGGVRIIAQQLAGFLAAYDCLDSGKLQEYSRAD